MGVLYAGMVLMGWTVFFFMMLLVERIVICLLSEFVGLWKQCEILFLTQRLLQFVNKSQRSGRKRECYGESQERADYFLPVQKKMPWQRQCLMSCFLSEVDPRGEEAAPGLTTVLHREYNHSHWPAEITWAASGEASCEYLVWCLFLNTLWGLPYPSMALLSFYFFLGCSKQTPSDRLHANLGQALFNAQDLLFVYGRDSTWMNLVFTGSFQNGRGDLIMTSPYSFISGAWQ